jgi:hypothetical protein
MNTYVLHPTPAHAEADSKKNPALVFEAGFEKVKHLDGVGDLDVAGRLAGVRAPVKYLKDISLKVMGWRQSAALSEVIDEVAKHIKLFTAARDLIQQDQGSIVGLFLKGYYG